MPRVASRLDHRDYHPRVFDPPECELTQGGSNADALVVRVNSQHVDLTQAPLRVKLDRHETNGACTHNLGTSTAYVELEYRHLLSQVYTTVSATNIINHESGHAFFYATHDGDPGIMNDFSTDRPDWPTPDDLADVAAWLGTSGGGGQGGKGGFMAMAASIESGVPEAWSEAWAAEKAGSSPSTCAPTPRSGRTRGGWSGRGGVTGAWCAAP